MRCLFGCLLGLFALLMGGFLLFISISMGIGAIGKYIQLQSYQIGQCTITAKQVLRVGDSEGYSFSPDFRFIAHTVDGHEYQGQGYRSDDEPYDQSTAQAVVDQYRVGKTYPCWYDPIHPTTIVLTREYSVANFLMPAMVFILAVVFISIVIFLVPSLLNKQAW